jgi:hypothetical protein
MRIDSFRNGAPYPTDSARRLAGNTRQTLPLLLRSATHSKSISELLRMVRLSAPLISFELIKCCSAVAALDSVVGRFQFTGVPMVISSVLSSFAYWLGTSRPSLLLVL